MLYKFRKIVISVISVVLVGILFLGSAVSVSATPNYWIPGISSEYRKNADSSDESKRYYTKLHYALCKNEEQGNAMLRVKNIALSQVRIVNNKYYPGYSNYSTIVNGKHNWTGLKLSNNSNGTGNTEYTRWFEEKVKAGTGASSDLDWCAIFVSWCLWYAGVNRWTSSAKVDLPYCYARTADPRIVVNANSAFAKSENFNMLQQNVTYTPRMKNKLLSGKANYKYYYKATNGKLVYNCLEPININYKPGGIIFFTYTGNFDHVGIVLKWDKSAGALTYISGNDGGQVKVRTIRFNSVDSQGRLVKDTIAAYAKYY